ncbi:hypothetical protein B0H34DRAFT_644984 [Crassisporium funariophilum]|nr:hypothetical protein B0H34DRAFT_644984 [Crassisporium funariophilum]
MEQLASPDSEPSYFDSSSPKGKEKESFPLLPPLTFSMIQLDYDRDVPPTPGPSSYGTLYSPPPTNANLPPTSAFASRDLSTPCMSPLTSPEPVAQDVLRHPVTRSRSLSNLSQRITPSLGSALSVLNSHGPPRTPSNLSRQLVLENRNKETHRDPLSIQPTQRPTESPSLSSTSNLGLEMESGSCPSAWYTVSKPSGINLSIVQTQPSAVPSLPELLVLNSSTRVLLKNKVRSRSSPYPISALDYVPIASTDLFQPLPIIIPNYFDLVLPKELRLFILRALVDLHEREYERLVDDNRLTMAKAISSRSRWVGKDKGIRELFRFGRVSKACQDLVFDGQLWTDLDLHSFPGLPPSIVVRLTQMAGPFVRSLNLAGHVQLPADNMTEITNNLCLAIPSVHISHTQLTTINLQGCTSITTRALHHLLVRSRALHTLCVKGLEAVTNTTCDIIANFCQRLMVLNISRCSNMDATGVRALAVASAARGEHLPLKELRMSGLRHVTDSMMMALGRAAPYLEILDLGYIRHLHNSAIEAFVACDGYDEYTDLGVETVVVTARDLGRESNDSGKFRRRVTRLRHLVLSNCILLTDTVCSNLAYSVPKLEYLELAGIGADLKDGGLIRLLSLTPFIRRIDLEDATDITDALLATITPYTEPASPESSPSTDAPAPKQPGHALQQLNISYAGNVTDEALLALIRKCTKLTVLEADNTRMGSAVLREFVRLSRHRKASNTKIVAIDCRGIGESLVKELSPMTRPRQGWREYGARKLLYLDARDDNDEDLKIGQDECDEHRVVLKTFYSWQTVDAIKAAKEKRRKLTSRRTASDSSTGTNEAADEGGASTGTGTRWWSPGGRRSNTRNVASGRTSPPILPDLNSDGCRTM